MKKGILLCGHGTRVQVGELAFKAFAEKFASTITDYEVEYGFLELSEPNFEQGVSKLKAKGVEEIIAVPVFLFNGVHIASDIPNTLHELQEKHEVNIKLANYIGVCQEMVDLSLDLIKKSISDEDMSDTAFFPIGIGASMADSNGDMLKLSRLAQEELKMPFMINAFTSRMTFPSVEKALAVLDQLSYKRIIALPYIFFPGVYLDNAIRSIEEFKQKHPELWPQPDDKPGDVARRNLAFMKKILGGGSIGQPLPYDKNVRYAGDGESMTREESIAQAEKEANN